MSTKLKTGRLCIVSWLWPYLAGLRDWTRLIISCSSIELFTHRVWLFATLCVNAWKRTRPIEPTTISKFCSNSRNIWGPSPTWLFLYDELFVELWFLPSSKRPAPSSWTTEKNSTRGLSSSTVTLKLMAELRANPDGRYTSVTGAFLEIAAMINGGTWYHFQVISNDELLLMSLVSTSFDD